LGKTAAPSKPSRAPAAHRAENLLEEIAETGAAEMKLGILAARPAAREPSPAREGFPAGRRTELGAGTPIRPQLVILLALGRVAQDFVGLIDFLELFLGLLFVFRHVRMVLPRQLAEGLLDVGFAGAAGHAQRFVVIFVSDRH